MLVFLEAAYIKLDISYAQVGRFKPSRLAVTQATFTPTSFTIHQSICDILRACFGNKLLQD